MHLTFTPLRRNRYRCNQFRKFIIKGSAIKTLRLALAKKGSAGAVAGILKQRSQAKPSEAKRHSSRFRRERS